MKIHRSVSAGRKEVEIESSLSIAGPGGHFAVRSTGQSVVVDFGAIRPCLDALRTGPGARWRRRAARELHAALDLAGLTLEFRVLGRRLARFGRRAEPTGLSRLLRLPEVEIGWIGAGLALLAGARRA